MMRAGRLSHLTRLKICRILLLAGRHLLANAARALLLVVMVATEMLIFLAVQELSAASRAQLRGAIRGDLGAAGTYEASLPPDVGIGVSKLADTVGNEIQASGANSLLLLADMGRTDTACPVRGSRSADEVPVYVVLRSQSSGRVLTDTDTGNGKGVLASPDEPAQVCLLGMPVVPDQMSTVDVAGILNRPGDMAVLDTRSFLQVSEALGQPRQLLVVFSLPSAADQSVQLKDRLVEVLSPFARRAGLADGWDQGIHVSRLERGTAIRRAERGVNLIYQVVGCGVLVLGGVGLLVAQMMTTRSRTWFFGLARVLGATGGDIAAMVLFEVGVVVALGSTAALALGAAVRPAVESWSANTLDVRLVIVGAGSLPRVVIGAAILSAAGAAYPAFRAISLDPVVALERGRE